MHSLKSWTAEKQQSKVLVKEEKKKLVSQMEKNMPDLLVGLVLVFFFSLATPQFITRNSLLPG